MAFVLADRVKETTTTSGTGTVTLTAPYDITYKAFGELLADGDSTYYAIVSYANGMWEIGIGTYTLAGDTLSRDTVLINSTGNTAKMSFNSDVKDVFITYPADKAVYLDDLDNLTVPGQLNSISIDDNANQERLQIGNGETLFGGNASSYAIGRGILTGAFVISGSTSGLSGSNMTLYGSGHANTGDVLFRNNGSTTLQYDHSATTWDFQAGDLTTTGTVTANNIELTGSGDLTVDGTVTANSIEGDNFLNSASGYLQTKTHADIGTNVWAQQETLTLTNAFGLTAIDANTPVLLFDDTAGDEAQIQYSRSLKRMLLAVDGLSSVSITATGTDFGSYAVTTTGTASASKVTVTGLTTVSDLLEVTSDTNCYALLKSTGTDKWCGVYSGATSQGFVGYGDGTAGERTQLWAAGDTQIDLYSSASANSGDIVFSAVGGTELQYDHSASVWDAQLNDIRTGGSFLADTVGGGLAFGTSVVAANTLDDYEEGSWTPVLTDGSAGSPTHVIQTGSYVKVGKLVTVKARLSISAKGSLSGQLRITGLPFTSDSAANTQGCISIGFANGMVITAGESVSGYIINNTTTILLRLWDATQGNTGLDTTEIGATFDMMFVGQYEV